MITPRRIIVVVTAASLAAAFVVNAVWFATIDRQQPTGADRRRTRNPGRYHRSGRGAVGGPA